MPLYRFKNESGDVQEVVVPFSEYDELEALMKRNGYERIWSLNVVSGKSTGLSKMDNGFNDLLLDMKKGSGKNNTINTK